MARVRKVGLVSISMAGRWGKTRGTQGAGNSRVKVGREFDN